ncbi:MAG: lamin tail domain-containing protein, partial [Patescibacteria group bacterium]|nr:lamin tail domain-containing protein [Patescibacteria group bacterium]
IELYNPTTAVVPLKNWIITDASKTGSYTFTTQEIAPLSYFVIYRSDFRFALNNSGDETVSLIAPSNKLISSMSYNETREDISLNRAKNWYFAEISPGTKNIDDPRTKYYQSLQLSELLPNPIGNENTDEFIEIYNPNNTSVNLKYWTLKDASKTGSYTFTANTIIKPEAYFTLYRSEFNFALNNSDETVSLIAPNEKVMSSISYKSSRENISYNYSPITKNWRWSKYLTPSKENIFNNLPTIKKFEIDDESYKNVYTEFETKASDKDGEELKVRWDFGDGRKSYKWKTRHKYTQTGTYYGNLRIQDESEEIIKKFIVTVKKYPKHKMKITKIVPNPAGKDSGTEYIIIKNKSNKKIDLKNWSIATGSNKKKLVNHPVHEKLIIKPGKTKKITKKYAAISLPNKTGIIEIRRPNGSVADTKEYGDKSVSIPDNASYEKINGIWQWLVPQDIEKLAQTNAIIMQALKNEHILSQQALESYIAFDAIYNPPTDINNTNLHTLSFFAKILQRINYILNIAITQTQLALFDRSQPTKMTYVAPLYNIPHTTNPCRQPTIFTSNNLHFCE